MPGTFTLRPIQANLTHDIDYLGKMDPYCSYRVGPNRVKGPICRNGGKFPKWEDATVSLPATNEPSMVVDLMDKDKVLFDDNIGSFVIDLKEIEMKGQLSKWYPVYWHKKPAGEILMEAAYQPEIIPQPVIVEKVIQEPVIVEKVIQEPVIVEKEIIREEIIEPTVTQKEFVSGPIIHGISQIHHGGQGYGLVPQHGPILSEGSHIQQGGIIQQGSTIQHSTVMHQGPYPVGSNLEHYALNQGGLSQGGLSQGGLIQGELNQGGLSQGGLNQGGLSQGGLNQGGLSQGSLGQSTLNQGNLGQGTLNQGGFSHGKF